MSNSEIESPLDQILGEEFLTWLWYASDTMGHAFALRDGTAFNIYMEQRIAVESGEGESKETATVSGSLSPLREARFGLGTGKKVTRALIRVEKDDMAFQFSLHAPDFRIAGLKTPKLDYADKDAEPDALLLEKIYLMETCMNCLDAIYEKFLNLRLSKEWPDVAARIGSWFMGPDA